MNRFDKICRDIKTLKVQGARAVAKAGVQAYYLQPTKQSKQHILSLRPTEPALRTALSMVTKKNKKDILAHFDTSQKKINILVAKKIKNKSAIFTHCHSTAVVDALIFARKKEKKFVVYNTETRPLYQGRITAKQLAKAGISVTTSVDSGMHDSIVAADSVMIGADAITPLGVINKIGSAAVAEIAHHHKKPVYIVSDSWKFSPTKPVVERRSAREVWNSAPRQVTVSNLAFDMISKNHITKIISELGILTYKDFIAKVQTQTH